MTHFQLSRLNFLLVLIASLSVIALACGEDEETPTSPAQPTTSVPATTAPATTVPAESPASSPDTSPEATPSPSDSDTEGDPQAGEALFTSQGCSGCHSTGSDRVVGPGLAGISERGDDAYIRQSIVESDAVIVEGYPNVMPDFSGLSDQQVADLVAYLKTLE